MNPHYPAVSARAGRRCEYCRAPEAIFNLQFEVEHIVPRSRGGSDGIENLALACRSCNLLKSDFQSGNDEPTNSEVALFNPRVDHWLAHFAFSPHSGAISGLTATGRATVKRLGINDPLRVTARRLWAQLQLFP